MVSRGRDSRRVGAGFYIIILLTINDVMFPGILSSVWFVLWMIFVSDSPSQHKRISKAERHYIMHALKDCVKADGDKVGCKFYLYAPDFKVM